MTENNQEQDKIKKVEESPAIKNARVHTMPDKFLTHLPRIKVKKKGKLVVAQNAAPKMSKGTRKSVVLAVTIAIIFVIIVALAAWFFIRSINQQPDDSNNIIPQENNQPQQETQPVTECTADDCSACNIQQCQQLAGQCKVDVIFEPCQDDPTQDCAVEKCVTDKTDEIFEKNEEPIIDDDFYDQKPNLTDQLITTSKDTDGDGLTDVEEQFWGTDYLDEDTDGDSYLDGQEVYNQYSPFAGESATISSDKFKTFSNPELGFSFMYPANMELIENQDSTGNLLVKATSTTEFFSIVITDVNGETDVLNWYKNNSAQGSSYISTEIGGTKAVVSPDMLDAYVIYNNKLYIFNYLPGSSEQLNFMTTFKMFLTTIELFSNPFEDDEPYM